MKQFKEWAEENTSIYEMAILRTPEGQPGVWYVKVGGQKLEVLGPGVFNILEDGPEEGMPVDKIAEELVLQSKFRPAGTEKEYRTLEEIAETAGVSFPAMLSQVKEAIKTRMRSQKGGTKGWGGKGSIVVGPGNLWKIGNPDAPVTGAGAKTSDTPDLDMEDIFSKLD